MKKRVISLLAAVLMFCSIQTPVYADNGRDRLAAETLYSLGLFSGIGTNADGSPNFGLEMIPTREQAIIMLVRLLGKEDEARAGKWDIPFTDVSESARPYVGYAYANGLTSGTSATTYGSKDKINVTQYMVFVMRALGYKDNVDFTWDNVLGFAEEIYLNPHGEYRASSRFDRGDLAIVSRDALALHLKGSDMRLIERVCNKPLDTSKPITEKSFCFFFPYTPPDEITGDLFLDGWGHGNPRNTRHFTLIVNGSIIKEGYTVECATEGFFNRAEVLEDGRFVVEAARSGEGKILITYKGVTADYRHIEF